MMFELDPLEITLPVQNGTYNVTISIKSHSDNIFHIEEESYGVVRDAFEIAENNAQDLSFKVTVTDVIKIKICCDGRFTATAFAEYEN